MRQLQLFQDGVQGLCLKQLDQQFGDTSPRSEVAGGVRRLPPALCAWEASVQQREGIHPPCSAAEQL